MRKGFTLIELSIVLVIIGLLIGGVLVAQSMIESARTNKLVSEMKQYQVFIRLFQERFKALPGDINRANTLFGTAAANGDGDGLIDINQEGFAMWEHMQLSGIIEGDYDGNGNTSASFIPGTYVPASKTNEDNGYTGWYSGFGGTGNFYGIQGNFLMLSGSDSNVFSSAALSGTESLALDKKIDDGSADSGDFVGINSINTTTYTFDTDCTTSAAPGYSPTSPAAYKITDTLGCFVALKLD